MISGSGQDVTMWVSYGLFVLVIDHEVKAETGETRVCREIGCLSCVFPFCDSAGSICDLVGWQ